MSAAADAVVGPRSRLQLAVLLLVAAAHLGLIAELAIDGHVGSPPQAIPFVLSGLGAVAAVGLAAWPRPLPSAARWGARAVFGLGVLGGLFGVWEHLEHNAAFAAEIAPNAGAMEIATEAVFGANPLLAPGAYALLGVLGWVASWKSTT